MFIISLLYHYHSLEILTSLEPVSAALSILTPPRSPLLGLGYKSNGAGEDAMGRLVMVVIPQLLTGSTVLTMNLGSMPDPDDSDLGLRKGSKSGGRPDVVELGIL